MREQRLSPSLLPYLAPGKGGTGLKIALLSEDSATLTGYPFPFLVIADADPVTRLIKAEFVTDAGSRIRDVFLLVQRDAYGLSTNQLAPLTNADIEGFWRQTHQYHSQHQGGSPLMTLQQQLDKQGKLTPFQALFFCTATRSYFHPPCPACGMPLQLCSNDQLLDSLALPQYSLSLRRYLFCPTCFSSGRDTDFYAHHRSALDPPLVKDCEELVRAFGQLVQEKHEISGLPCILCPQNEQCFGPAAASASLIVPFSFYPFYMLIYEAMSLNGLDFIALLAGASIEALEARLKKTGEPGRASYLRDSEPGRRALRPFLFENDARLFLEILYLKLSFLEQVITELLPDQEKEQPDPLLYMDRIWVRLTDRSGLLPYLWNFELNYIDLVRNPLDFPVHPPMPPAYALHLLGLIWFTVLLANSKQEVSQLQQAIERARDRALQNDPILPDNLMEEPAFLPENVLWNPAPPAMAQGWQGLWTEALSIGCSLLQASVRGRSSGFSEELIRTIEHLRASIKGKMLSEHAAEKDADRPAESAAIHDILSRLVTKWRQSTVLQSQDEWEETVVLPSDASFEATLSPGAGSGSEPDDTSETLIMTSPKALQPVAEAVDEEIFQETVILSGKRLKETFQKHVAPPPGAAEELAETMILAPSPKPEERGGSPGVPGAAAPVQAAGEEILPETVILPPARKLQAVPRSHPDPAVPRPDLEPSAIPSLESEGREDATAKKPKPGEEDEMLSATIILSPSKDRDKK